jgi:N-acetylmuramoyl-L-alanine amidase
MKLCIDPGHGNRNVSHGYDPGAVGGGLTEADIVLDWALTGKWVLVRAGIAVWLTRHDDSEATPLMTRDERAEAAGCTHYLSLHCNSAVNVPWRPAATGTEAFYRDGVDKAWAGLVQSCAVNTLQLRDRGLKTEAQSPRGKLHVLDFQGPGTLLELGFISNSRDRSVLTSREKRIAFWERLSRRLVA